MRKIWLNWGLSISLLICFLVSQIGVSIVGMVKFNDEQKSHHQSGITYIEYVQSAEFLEATMENWESEFLQMFAYVIFTVYLYQKGSAESKAPGQRAEVDADPRFEILTPATPWPVKRGGLILALYENSLSLALFILFLVAFVLHAVGGAAAYSHQQILHGELPVTTLEYLAGAQFWFESLQNWQSEFFSIALMVLLSVFLRQRGSPESKPVATPHWQNG